MTDHDSWQRSNDEYLGLALAWLRARLDAIAPVMPAPQPAPVPPQPASPITPPAPPVQEERRSSTFWNLFSGRERRQNTQEIPTFQRTPAPAGLIAAPRLGAADPSAEAVSLASELATREAADPPPALVSVTAKLELSKFERDVLLLACAMELDTRIAARCARAHDDPAKPYPTFALAMSLFDTPSWDVLSPERPLRFWRLIEITQPSGVPLMMSALRADERVVNYIKGLNYLDDRLAPLVRLVSLPIVRVALPASHTASVRRIIDALPREAAAKATPTVFIAGTDAPTKQLIATSVCAELGRDLYHMPAEALPAQVAEVEMLARLWDREAALMPLALYLDESVAEGPATEVTAARTRFAARARSLMFASIIDQRPPHATETVVVDVERPTAPEQREIWKALLGDGSDDIAGRLSAQFDLGVTVIQHIVDDARAGSGGLAPTLDTLWAASLSFTRPALDRLAQRIDARASWDDIVLPAEQAGTLKQLVAQVRQRSRVYDDWGFGERMTRGKGIAALFAGESGTGKTMAAEVIAQDLRLELYRIDLSGVVSKYIGETEKNLRRVFDAAETGGAILLFDEADALFGKRSEVKDSHDRYANVEINYLLQRLEAYRGLAILTTNMKGAIDPSFIRRLRFVVDFPFPGVPDRKRIWSQVFPAATERTDLDLDRLARFTLTGGSIHNAALNAAFLAADAGDPVTMPRVLEAIRGEYRKLARPVSESEFRWLVADAGGGARA
jgi:AAA+ superfamily predicted ATPase